MLSPYDIRTEETRNRIFGERECYIPNKVYKSAEGEFYFYINTKGYFHILKPCGVKYGEKIIHYEITDYLLTKENTLRETSSIGTYKTIEDCVQAIESI